MSVLGTILKTTAVLAPFAVGGTILVNVLQASEAVVILFVFAVGAACGIVPFFFDDELSLRRRH